MDVRAADLSHVMYDQPMSHTDIVTKNAIPLLVRDSAPTAIPISISPDAIAFAISCVAFRLEEQKRAVEEAPVVLGNPAARDAARKYRPALPSSTYAEISIKRW